MKLLRRSGYVVLLACGLIFPVTLEAQSAPSPATAPVSTRTAQQKRGEGLFHQYCPICHISTGFEKEDVGFPTRSLVGLFRRENPPSEEFVRQRILQGFPKKMPSWRYNFTPSEIDALIAHLKTL